MSTFVLGMSEYDSILRRDWFHFSNTRANTQKDMSVMSPGELHLGPNSIYAGWYSRMGDKLAAHFWSAFGWERGGEGKKRRRKCRRRRRRKRKRGAVCPCSKASRKKTTQIDIFQPDTTAYLSGGGVRRLVTCLGDTDTQASESERQGRGGGGEGVTDDPAHCPPTLPNPHTTTPLASHSS